MRIPLTDYLVVCPLASKSLFATGVGNNPARHLSNLRNRGIYIIHDGDGNVAKIGASTNLPNRIRALNTLCQCTFVVAAHAPRVIFHFEYAFQEFCRSSHISGEYFTLTPRIQALARHLSLHAEAIADRIDQLIIDYISRNEYFDYERAFLWACNPSHTYPPPYRGVENSIILQDVPIEAVTGNLANLEPLTISGRCAAKSQMQLVSKKRFSRQLDRLFKRGKLQ